MATFLDKYDTKEHLDLKGINHTHKEQIDNFVPEPKAGALQVPSKRAYGTVPLWGHTHDGSSQQRLDCNEPTSLEPSLADTTKSRHTEVDWQV